MLFAIVIIQPPSGIKGVFIINPWYRQVYDMTVDKYYMYLYLLSAHKMMS